MKKLKLLFAAFALTLGVSNASAQTDVTSTYITNADFSSTDGWTANQSSQYNAIGNGLIGTFQINSGVAATVDENHPATSYCFGMQSRWSTNYAYYTQETAELPAGYYRLTFDVQNTNSSTTSCVYDNFCYVTVGSDKYIDSEYRNKKTEWMQANTDWTTHTINFRVKEASTATVSLGYGQATNNYGNNATPYIYISNLKLEQLSSKPDVIAIDKTSLITNNDMTDNVSGWSSTTGAQNKARATNQTGDFRGGFYENWNGSAYTGKMYQTVTGLPTGIYELSMCAFVNNVGDAGTQYIYAGSNKTNITTAAPTQYTVTNVEVNDGSLEIGFEQIVAAANWCGIDYATLVKIGDPDLSAFVTAYKTALASAKEVAATTETISATVLANLNSVINTYDEGNVDEDSQDALETATAALTEATTAANTSIASYAVIAAGSVPDNSLDGWTCENAQTFHINTWSIEGNSDGSNMKTPFIENWVGKGSYLGAGKVYYQLSGLEPGEVYYAQALVRSYNEASSDAPNGPNFFINDEVVDMTKAGTTFTYNNMSGIYATLGGAATVGEDGILKLGIEIAEDRNYNWVAFKNVSISSMDDAFEAAVAKVTALEGTIPTAAYNVAYAVVTEWNAKYPTTAAGFEQAISEIEAAATTASECVTPYAAYKATHSVRVKAEATASLENLASEDAATLNSTISSADEAVEACETVEDLEATIETQEENLWSAIGTAINTIDLKEGDKLDLTYLLTNPDLTGLATWNPADGWASEETDGNSQVMVNDSKTVGDKSYFYEYWSSTAKASGKFALYNAVTLPEGTFSMSCYAFAEDQNTASPVDGVYFYANETKGSCVTATVLTQQTLSFVNKVAQEVKIGLKTVEGNTRNWMGIGYVELYKVPAKTYTVSEDVAWDNTTSGAGDVTLTRNIKKGFNTLVLPFSMTQAEVEATFGTGSLVYELSQLDGEVIRFQTANGISPNKPCILKATEPGTSYEIEGRTIVAADDANPTATVSGVSLIGNYAALLPVGQNENNFVVSGDKLYYVDSAVTIKCTRAYFNVEGGSEARTIALSFDGEVTGIATVENGEVKKVVTGDIYDLTGRKVKNPSNGIFIVEGKKVVF